MSVLVVVPVGAGYSNEKNNERLNWLIRLARASDIGAPY